MRIAAVTLVLCCLLILGPLAHISSEVAAGDVPPVEVWVLDRSGSFNTTLRSTAFDAGEYRWVASIPGPPSTAERLREFPESSVWGVYLAELPSLEQVSALVDRLRPLKPRGILLPFLEKGEWLTPEVLAALLSLPDIEHVHIYFQRQEVPDWVLEQLSGLGALSSLYLDNCTRISVGAFRKLCEKRGTTLEALLLGTTAIPVSELIPLRSLKRLTIDGDPRSTFALTGIGKLQSLESLQLRRGMIAGDGYAEVLALKGLHKLHLAWGADGTVPRDVIKGLAGLPAVRDVYMPVAGSSDLTGLAAMPSLARVGLSIRSPASTDLSPLGAAQKLESLAIITNGDLTTPFAGVPGNLNHLKELRLYGNFAPGKSMPLLASAGSLTRLEIFGFSRIPDEVGSDLSAIPSLTELRIDGKVRDGFVWNLTASKNIAKLALDCQNLSETSATELAKMKGLVELSLKFCWGMSDDAARSLSALQGLRLLELIGGCYFTNACLDHLSALKRLDSLYFHGSGVTNAALWAHPLSAQVCRSVALTGIDWQVQNEVFRRMHLPGQVLRLLPDIRSEEGCYPGAGSVPDALPPFFGGFELRWFSDSSSPADIWDASRFVLLAIPCFHFEGASAHIVTEDGAVRTHSVLTREQHEFLRKLQNKDIRYSELPGSRIEGAGLKFE